jgi:hypothetical protein
MNAQRWEYKVAYIEGWRRISVEGDEMYPEEGERHSAFGRRFLNTMGAQGWELVDVQLTMPNRAYYVFKRALVADAEPDLSVVRQTAAPQTDEPPQEDTGAQVISL